MYNQLVRSYKSIGEVINSATTVGHTVFGLVPNMEAMSSVKDFLETSSESAETMEEKADEPADVAPPAKRGKYTTRRSGAQLPDWSKSLNPNDPLQL